MIATNSGIEMAKAADKELQKVIQGLSETDDYISGHGTTSPEYLLKAVRAWRDTRKIAATAPDWISDDAEPPGVYAAGS